MEQPMKVGELVNKLDEAAISSPAEDAHVFDYTLLLPSGARVGSFDVDHERKVVKFQPVSL